jgi:hypothetical protein
MIRRTFVMSTGGALLAAFLAGSVPAAAQGKKVVVAYRAFLQFIRSRLRSSPKNRVSSRNMASMSKSVRLTTVRRRPARS